MAARDRVTLAATTRPEAELTELRFWWLDGGLGGGGWWVRGGWDRGLAGCSEINAHDH